MHIVQGDNNVIIPFFAKKKRTDSIANAMITVSINRGVDIITKQATILDVSTGQCNFTLTSSDLVYAGEYEYEWIVSFSDGTNFTGGPSFFYVANPNNPIYNNGTASQPLTSQIASLTANMGILNSLTPESIVISLNGLAIGNFYIPRNKVSLGTITLA